MSELNRVKKIFELLNVYEGVMKDEICSYLSLSNKLNNLVKSSEYRPPYQLNLLDIIGVKETLTSRIVSLIFKYKIGNDYILCRSFIEEFLVNRGFDSKWIKSPSIEAERDRIDVKVWEEDKYTIIIENKLKGAPFRRNQIARYIQKMKDSGYPDDRIFIVVLPDYVDRLFFDHIKQSVWYLPKDWRAPNREQRCYKDEYSCLCDSGEACPLCKDCNKDFRQKFTPRTVILDLDFINWLENRCLSLISVDECLLRSAIIQFVDFLKGVFNNRLNHKLVMEIVEFLREQLIDADKPLIEQWRTIENKRQEVQKLISGLENLQTSIGKEQIDAWRDLLMPKWGQWLKCENRKSFGINIQGVWCGCWCDEGSGVKPYWGFQCDSPTQEQIEMVNRILEKVGNTSAKPEPGWIAWYYTWHGDERCNDFYVAARELGYLK